LKKALCSYQDRCDVGYSSLDLESKKLKSRYAEIVHNNYSVFGNGGIVAFA